MNNPTYEAFAESLNSDFSINGEVAQDLKLIEVSERKLGSGQEQFWLTFRGTPEHPLEQKIFAMDHPVLGAFEIFLVPIRADDEGRYYQAVFNRFTESRATASDESQPA